MFELEEMPYLEKYTSILEYTRMVEDFAPKLVKKELGKEKANKLREIWEKR